MPKFFALITLFFISHNAFAKENQQSAMYYQHFDDEDEFAQYEKENIVEIYDPLEKYNRKIYKFNDTLDSYILEPVVKSYRDNVPEKARDAVHNFLTNLSAPVSVLNSLLQLEINNALSTTSNFLINSTLGVGGIFNVAERKGIKYQKDDFGKTLGHYGAGAGAYLMLPILGPSSVRDFTGFAFDKAIDPVAFNVGRVGGEKELIAPEYSISLVVASGIDKREGLIDIIDDIRKDSFDPYATIRSAYLQKRESEIKINLK